MLWEIWREGAGDGTRQGTAPRPSPTPVVVRVGVGDCTDAMVDHSPYSLGVRCATGENYYVAPYVA